MKRSTERILTTHVGSLPRPDELMALYRDNAPDERLQPRLRATIGDIVRRQAETGIDVANDGEFGKAMRSAMDFGAWWSYVYPRLAGYELREEQAKKGRAAWTFGSKERKEFAEFYAAEASAAATAQQGGTSTARLYGLTCTGPVKYVGGLVPGAESHRTRNALRRATFPARASVAYPHSYPHGLEKAVRRHDALSTGGNP